jgi:hypothetical protein
LALLVSSQLHQPAAVTPAIVRKWEAGQPPKDLEELEALCHVMRRHGLTAQESGYFRDAVLAACLDWHYDGLFGEERLSPTAEVEELVSSRQPWDPVDLVARQHLLTQYVNEPPVRPCPPRLLRRWQAAQCLLLGRECHLHTCAKRHLQEVGAIRQKGALLAAVFGPNGLDGYMHTPAQTRMAEAHTRAHDLREPGAAERLLALASEFRAEGNLRHCALSLLDGVWALANDDCPRFVHAERKAEVDWALTFLDEHLPEADRAAPHFSACNALVAEGSLRLAETHLPMVERMPRGLFPAVWPWTLGRFAFVAGDFAEAQGHFERARVLAVTNYGDWVTDSALDWLGKCEGAQHDTRHQGKGRIVSSQAAGE